MLGWITAKAGRLLLSYGRYDFLFRPDGSGEVVSLDCETTGFDVRADDVISIAAIRIRGNRILASEASVRR
jgi:DNA polymerase-3 subunit epsilon